MAKPAASLLAVVVLSACHDKKPPPETSAPPVTSAPSSSAAAPVDAAHVRLTVKKGKGSFLIDAPLEKIKGASDEAKGQIDVDPKDLSKSHGEIDVRLASLKTATFEGNAKDNAAQTAHARNWMEVGDESPADARKKYEWATFVVRSVSTETPVLADVKEDGGVRAVKAKVSGDLTIHGVTSAKTVAVTAKFKGPADAPTELEITSDAPMDVSMKEHGVMPRDKLGSFLNGALEKIGKKIDDKVQVSIEVEAAK